MRQPSLRRLHRRVIETLCAGVVIITLLGPVHAGRPPVPAGMPSLPTAETPVPTSAAVDPVMIDPFIQLRGSVWRTKAGIVFLKTPIGLLTLSSKTTLKDLKASQEVRFWVHERHSVVEIRKRADGSLVHRYLSGPMTSETDTPRTLRWWGPDGDQTVRVGAEEGRLTAYHDGDPLTVEVDETNTLRGVHDLQFDLQISQAPPAGADVQLLLSGTVSKLKSNFVFVRTPIGLVMLNSKIGIPRVKVGQSLTLRIDHEHVTVTVPSTETSTSRRNVSPIP
jgi:predicted transcriptional regulator